MTTLKNESTMMLAAAGGVSAVSYLASLFAVWLLAPDLYSVFASTVSLLYIVSVITTAAVQWPLAKLLALGDRSGARRVATTGMPALAVIASTGVALAALQYTDPTTAGVAALAALLIAAGGAASGYLQGSGRVPVIAGLRIAEASVRAAFTVVGALAAFVPLALLGFAAGTGLYIVLAAVVSFRARTHRIAELGDTSALLATTLAATGIQGLSVLMVNAAVLSVAIFGPGASAELGTYQALSTIARVPYLAAGALAVAMFVPLARGLFTAGRDTLSLYLRVGSVIAVVAATLPAPVLDLVLGPDHTWSRSTLVGLAVSGWFAGLLAILAASAQARTTTRWPLLFLMVFVPANAALSLAAWSAWGSIAMAWTEAALLAVAVAFIAPRVLREVPKMSGGLSDSMWLAWAVPFAVLSAVATTAPVVVFHLIMGAAVTLAALRISRHPRGDDRALRILHLTFDADGQTRDGRFTTERLARLSQLGHEITTVTRAKRNSDAASTQGLETLGARGLLRNLVSRSAALATFTFSAAAPFRLGTLIGKHNPDVIIDELGSPITGLPLRWMTRRPVVRVIRDYTPATGLRGRLERHGIASERTIIVSGMELVAALTGAAPHAEIIPILDPVDEPGRERATQQFAAILAGARRHTRVVHHETDAVLSSAFPAGAATLLLGNYGNSNTGDEAILARTLELMGEGVALTVATRNPHRVAELHGVPSVAVASLDGVAAWLRADRVVVGGGGRFSAHQTPLVSLLPAFLLLSKAMGKSIAFAGIGAYPGMPIVSRFLLAWAARLADVFIVRDAPATRVVDLRWGPRRVDVVPDAGFGLPGKPREAQRLLAAARIDSDRPLLLIAPKVAQDPITTEQMARAQAEAVRAWRARGGQVAAVLLSDKSDYGHGLAGSDGMLAARVFALADAPYIAFGPNLDPRVAKSLFANADAVLGLRLHSLVFAAAANIPMASVTFEEKSRALLERHRGYDIPGARVDQLSFFPWVEETFPANARIHREELNAGVPETAKPEAPPLPRPLPDTVDILLNRPRRLHPKMSIVIPTYNTGAQRLSETVRRALKVVGPEGEVVVVDDGSRDGSAQALSRVPGTLLVIRQRNGGKGSALRRGMSVARGRWVGLVDADGQYLPEELPDLVAAARKSHRLAAVGQRDLSQAGYTLFRKLTSWAFRTWTRIWLPLNVPDTQAGIKVVAGSTLPMLLAELTEDSFAFDVDLLAAFERLGITPATGSVTFHHDDQSTVTLGRGAAAFAGVLRVAERHRKAVQSAAPAGDPRAGATTIDNALTADGDPHGPAGEADVSARGNIGQSAA
jgi:polysaccharide pyruvyl transferase WcaK-like protein